MKTIKLFDDEMEIVKEVDEAYCVYSTTASNLDTYEDSDVVFGQKVYKIKILKTGSIIFTLTPESEVLHVTAFPQMFGIATPEQIDQITNLENKKDKLSDEIKEVFDNIERVGYTEIKF